jgi:hypothetical protein
MSPTYHQFPLKVPITNIFLSCFITFDFQFIIIHYYTSKGKGLFYEATTDQLIPACLSTGLENAFFESCTILVPQWRTTMEDEEDEEELWSSHDSDKLPWYVRGSHTLQQHFTFYS